MSTFAERWLEGALFLSLDLTRPFFTELWVPIDDAAKFQSELRILLKESLDEESYYSEREALGYRVIAWFYNSCRSENFEVFSSWIRNILVVEGPDRPGETFWSVLSSEMARRFENNSLTPQWIGELMSAIVSLERVKGAELDDKIEAAEDQQPAEWDAHVLAVKNSSADAMLIKISLIGRYNIFLANWERHGAILPYPKLHELWSLGKKMMPHFGMEASDLVFPGVWRFESRRLLSRFTQLM